MKYCKNPLELHVKKVNISACGDVGFSFVSIDRMKASKAQRIFEWLLEEWGPDRILSQLPVKAQPIDYNNVKIN